MTRGRLFAGEIAALAIVLALATAFFLFALVAQSGGFIMKRVLVIAAAVTAAVALSGCTSLGQSNSAELLKQIDTNFAQCERHITFQAGVGVVTPGAQISGSVDCKGGTPLPLGTAVLSTAGSAPAQ